MKVIKLSGRIDSNNAGIVESEISSQLAENPGETPAFDAENLTYISSAGLRVLLKVSKNYRAKLDVLNVCDEVYNIFDVTGFTELFNVRKKLREISIDGLEIIGYGGFSTVYRLDSETVIKVFDKNSAGFEGAERDRTASREAFIHGIPTAIAYDTVKAGEYYGLVYEMIDADTLAATVSKHPERLEELSAKSAHLLRKLHATEFEPGTFRDGREKLREMIQKPCDMGIITQDDKEFLDGIIDRIPSRNTFIHMDYHPKNIMVSGDDLILIDVGGAGLGDPIIDLLISYSFFFGRCFEVDDNVRKFHEKNMGLPAQTLGAMWNIITQKYFGTSDKNILSRYCEAIKEYSPLFMFYIMMFDKTNPDHDDRREKAAEIMRHLREISGTLKTIEGI